MVDVFTKNVDNIEPLTPLFTKSVDVFTKNVDVYSINVDILTKLTVKNHYFYVK